MVGIKVAKIIPMLFIAILLLDNEDGYFFGTQMSH